MRILLACERSAGHIFPALCFGKKFIKNSSQGFQDEVYFFVTSSFLKPYIEKEGFKVVGRSFSFRNLIIEGTWRLFEALYLILKLKPDRVIGFGGRDSFFLLLFSSFLFLDTAVYEPNIELGRANKFLSLLVRQLLRGFPDAKAGKKTQIIGIPLRQNLKKIDKFTARKILNFNHQPVILCFGGSQGSVFINHIFTKFIQAERSNYQIIHLTGKEEYFRILEIYNKIKNNKFVKDFYYLMEILYSCADIVVCRSGAITLAELAYYRLPSILIPHPQGSGHQIKNAFYFKQKGAAFVCPQDNFCFDYFNNTLYELIDNNNLRQTMSEKISNINLGVNFEEFCNNTYY